MSGTGSPAGGKGTGRWQVLFRRGFDRLAAFWSTPGVSRAAICSPLVGFLSGLAAVAFVACLQAMNTLVLGGLLHYHAPATLEGGRHAVTYPSPWWLTVLLPAAGGLVAGLLVFPWRPRPGLLGSDAMIAVFHKGGGIMQAKEACIKAVSAIVTMGTGGSAGQEGPMTEVGAGFGSSLARLLRLPADDRRTLMLAGAAAGVGAVFRAPLGGALYAGEVLYSSTAFESAALLPCLASSIIAYSTFALFITPEPVFSLPALRFQGLRELPLYAGLALLCAGLGWLYVRTFYGLKRRVFRPLPIPPPLKPAVGGLLVGLLGLAYPQVMTAGYGWVQWGAIGMPPALAMPGEPTFVPQMGMTLALTLCVLKILATSFTLGSGGGGGLFGPSMVIGGLLGGFYGQLMAMIVPIAHVDPAAFVLVGMGGFFAGVSKTPLTSIVIVSEITGSYSLLVPLMLACALTMALSRRWTLFEDQVASPIDSPAHQGDFVVDVLDRIRVRDVTVRTMNLEPIPASMPFHDLIQRVARSSESLFPVLDAQGRLRGVFTLRDVRLALVGADWGPLVLADDLAIRPVLAVTPDDTLHTALRRMTELNVDELPVVSPADHTRLIGLLSRRVLTSSYTSMVESLRTPSPGPSET